MLSEKNNMINLGNYEEYFILYMDNELSADDKLMVESFLSEHPDLRGEMDMLLSTKLPLEDFSFSVKEELLSLKMKMEAADESLLLYIDGEAGIAQKNKIEHQLKTDKDFQLEYSLLMRTKLDASEIIRYPDKKELYRRAEKVVAIRLWMKIAAAVIVLLFITGLLLVFNHSDSKTPVVAVTNALKKQNTLPVIPKEIPAPVIHEGSIVLKEVSPEKEITNQKENNIQQHNDQIVPKKDVVENKPKNIKIDRIETKTDNVIALTPGNKSINKLPVTKEIPGTSGKTDDVSSDVAVNEEPNNKGTFKGFLRKAARVIERRTGIGAANDDNELLIGAVAVKLK